MQFWTIAQAPLRKFAYAGAPKFCDIPPYTVVDTQGAIDLLPNLEWDEVVYSTASKTFTGWVRREYLEEYTERYPTMVQIDHQTPNPRDAEQYMTWKNNVQFNMCGEICMAYILGVSLTDILATWERTKPTIFQRVFRNGRAGGTGPGDLESIAATYKHTTQSLTAALKDPVLGRVIATPRRMDSLLDIGYPVVGVKISSATGNLQSSGILHWVVPMCVTANGVNSGSVLLYNPFPNRFQEYSWREFATSMGTPYGILVHFPPSETEIP